MNLLVLASASHTRARLLQAAGISFEAMPARIAEEMVKESFLANHAKPRAIADALAELKAVRISTRMPQSLILGADQVLELDGELISKSATLDDAAALLRRLRGQTHCLITAAVLARAGAPIWRHVDIISLTMRDFSDDFLARYLTNEGKHVLTSVGCYRLEGLGLQLFSRIEGDYFSILGLPMLPLLTVLRDQGIISQ